MKRFMLRTIAGVTLALVGVIELDTVPADADDHVIKERIHLMRKGVLGNFKVIMAFVKDGKGRWLRSRKRPRLSKRQPQRSLRCFRRDRSSGRG